jgi:hypothetical protein
MYGMEAICGVASTLAFTRIDAFSTLARLHALPTKDGLIAFTVGLIPTLGGTFMHWRSPQGPHTSISSSVRHSQDQALGG